MLPDLFYERAIDVEQPRPASRGLHHWTVAGDLNHERGVEIACGEPLDRLKMGDAFAAHAGNHQTVRLQKCFRDYRAGAAGGPERDVPPFELIDGMNVRVGAYQQMQRVQIQHCHAPELIEGARCLLELSRISKICCVGQGNTHVDDPALQIHDGQNRRPCRGHVLN